MTNLVGDFILENPDGSIQFNEKNIFTHKKLITKAFTGFVMLDPAIDLTPEENDPKGACVIKILVRDNVFNNTATGEYSITVK